MNAIGICPTYSRPMLIPNVLAMWQAQTFPASDRHLIILDDAGQFDSQRGDTWHLESRAGRFPTLAAKFGELLSLACDECVRRQWSITETVVVVWEDDDVYLPSHIERHVAAQMRDEAAFSAPSEIWANDGCGAKRVHLSHATGRHHGAWAYRLSLGQRVGYGEADFINGIGFDLMFGARLRDVSPVANTTPPEMPQPHYVYRWFSVPGVKNGSAFGAQMMASQPPPTGRVSGPIIGRLDAEAEHYIRTLS